MILINNFSGLGAGRHGQRRLHCHREGSFQHRECSIQVSCRTQEVKQMETRLYCLSVLGCKLDYRFSTNRSSVSIRLICLSSPAVSLMLRYVTGWLDSKI